MNDKPPPSWVNLCLVVITTNNLQLKAGRSIFYTLPPSSRDDYGINSHYTRRKYTLRNENRALHLFRQFLLGKKLRSGIEVSWNDNDNVMLVSHVMKVLNPDRQTVQEFESWLKRSTSPAS